MQKIKKHYLIGLLLLVIICLVIGISTKKAKYERKSPFFGSSLLSASQITCKYPQLATAIYKDGQIVHALSNPEKNPLIFTFSQFKDNEQEAQLSYIDSTQTITNVPVIKIIDSQEKMIFLDGGVVNYFSTYTIFKKSGVALYTKSVDVFGIPYGTIGMGSCSGY